MRKPTSRKIVEAAALRLDSLHTPFWSDGRCAARKATDASWIWKGMPTAPLFCAVVMMRFFPVAIEEDERTVSRTLPAS